jgi:hypothetical protein
VGVAEGKGVADGAASWAAVGGTAVGWLTGTMVGAGLHAEASKTITRRVTTDRGAIRGDLPIVENSVVGAFFLFQGIGFC